MTTFLVVKFDDDCQKNEVIPESWFHEGVCAVPSKNIREAAEKCEVIKMAWKRYSVTILSSHGKFKKIVFLVKLS